MILMIKVPDAKGALRPTIDNNNNNNNNNNIIYQLPPFKRDGALSLLAKIEVQPMLWAISL
jgi:hypothetical protein